MLQQLSGGRPRPRPPAPGPRPGRALRSRNLLGSSRRPHSAGKEAPCKGDLSTDTVNDANFCPFEIYTLCYNIILSSVTTVHVAELRDQERVFQLTPTVSGGTRLLNCEDTSHGTLLLTAWPGPPLPPPRAPSTAALRRGLAPESGGDGFGGLLLGMGVPCTLVSFSFLSLK